MLRICALPPTVPTPAVTTHSSLTRARRPHCNVSRIVLIVIWDKTPVHKIPGFCIYTPNRNMKRLTAKIPGSYHELLGDFEAPTKPSNSRLCRRDSNLLITWFASPALLPSGAAA